MRPDFIPECPIKEDTLQEWVAGVWGLGKPEKAKTTVRKTTDQKASEMEGGR